MNNEVRIKFGADSVELDAAVSKGKAGVQALATEAVKATPALASVGTTAAKGAQQANSAFQKLAAGLSLVSPEAAQVARDVGMAAQGFEFAATSAEVLETALLPIGIAAAGLTAVVGTLYYAHEQAAAAAKKQEAALDRLTDATKRSQEAMLPLDDAIKLMAQRYELATGQMTAQEGVRLKERASIENTAAVIRAQDAALGGGRGWEWGSGGEGKRG